MRRKTFRRRVVRVGLIAFNFVLLGGVTGILMMNRTQADTVNRAAVDTPSDTAPAASPLDQLSSANIALTVARMGNMPETTAITNQADSESIELDQVATSNLTMAVKPQVVNSTFKSAQDIKTYVTVSGDTISNIASKFGITSDSIRWSNDLTGDSVPVGKSLVIPPVSGIVYTVKAGDTADSLASKFNADKAKIIAFNDAEIGGLAVGQRIIVPGGTKAAAVARSVTRGSTYHFTGTLSYGYNGYDYGYCTWWVAKLRAAAGNPVPVGLGNASTWYYRATAFGLPTGSTPRVGAAVVTSTRGAGHVAYVTAVHDDGSITISEMNHIGWNRTDTRDLPANSSYRYIY